MKNVAASFALSAGAPIDLTAGMDRIDALDSLSRRFGCPLGSGASGSVYKVSPNSVVKLFREDDIGTFKYYELCMKKPRSFTPKVYNLLWLQKFSIVEMELLKPYTYDSFYNSYETSSFRRLANIFYRKTESLRDIFQGPFPRGRLSKEITAFIDEMMDIYNNNPINFDLHGGNVMYRNNNAAEWVITDPFYIGRW